MKSFKNYLNQIGEIGFVETTTKSIVRVNGLPLIKPEEVVLFETGQSGQALFLYPDEIEVLLFSPTAVKSGTRAVRTNERLSIPVGKELLGQVINPLGQRLSLKGPFRPPRKKRLISKASPGIAKRTQVRRSLTTGVVVVDTLIPLGHGQRELVIGDRKTGKTSFLLQTVLNQAKKGVICLWAVIGKRREEIKRIEAFFEQQKVKEKMVIIAASAQDPAGLIYLCPYTAITLAEYFRDQGLSSLVILDDLTLHAKFYRELALVAKRFPGRDSYPIDIFYTHAAIMEKGGNFKGQGENVSITILPVAETTQGDLRGYIQTNLMSMTDGHLYFDRDLFAQGRRPAINPFLSVTRVGRQTQTPLNRQIGRELMSFLTHHQKLESYIHFGAELTEQVKADLKKGERLLHFFEQKPSDLIAINIAVYLLGCLWLGFWPDKKLTDLKKILNRKIKKYQQEKKFKKEVDQIIKKSKDWQSLLRKLKKKK